MQNEKERKMKKKHILTAIALLAAVFCSVFGIVAEASFGSGVAVIAEKTEIVKGAISGGKVIFSDLDFKQGLCITDFESIKIVSAPKSTDGTLMLAGRRVGDGTVIKRKNIGALVFIPATKDVTECRFSFSIDSYADGAEIDFILRFAEKVNYAPTVADSSAGNEVITQRDISVYGRLLAEDQEGDGIEYMIIKYPSVGSVRFTDANSGEFVYTPPASYTGSDSFTYVARDEFGNFSKPCEVSVEIVERMCETVYRDLISDESSNAAVALTAIGAVDGRLIGDGIYFCPDETVTRAEFVTMAMKCAGMEKDGSLTSVYFDDADEIPAPMLPYIATAARAGIITGYFDGEELLFSPNSPITKYEAAMIMSALYDGEANATLPVFKDADTYPVWATEAIATMCSLGIFDSAAELIEADSAMTKRDCVSALYKMMNL